MKCEKNIFSKDSLFVKDLFNQISKNYDKLNNIMSFGLHRKIKLDVINKIHLSPSPLVGEGNFSARGTSAEKMGEGYNYKCLDLCCGTGDLARILKDTYLQSEVIGVDFSQNMLEIARKKHPDIEFLEADCTQLPFEDESFDLCIISFGLRNIENMEKALKEIYRVLKKDGYFINLDLGKPNKFFNFFLKPYMYLWVSLLGKLFHGNETPYKYLAVSNETFPSQKELVKIFEMAGFSDIKNKNYLFGQIASQISKK